ncbi:ABC transporter permease [Sphingomonas sp. PAMC 26605]|uniref:ABC transporter permease n=1 Tax=Sphingomonas sp. PAMC 26605 TaxID=1112214 RepID=UPI00026CA6F1|nr:ABC transporter permease [Sphingomonas sp. PAMC 26605]
MTAFGRALRTELAHLARDRWDQAGLFVVPAMLLFLMAAMLWRGTMHDLPVLVVDSDQSAASRAMIRSLDASPVVQIVGFRQSERAAVIDVRRGAAMGFVHLPAKLGEGLARHRTPMVRVFYNGSFLSAGSLLARGVDEAIADASRGLLTSQLSSHALPPDRTRRFAVEATLLGNAATSFEWYLGALIFPAVLHLVTAGVCAMALGRELADRSLARWARDSGGVTAALTGKMLPYFAVMSLWGVAWLLYLTLARGWRVEGSLAVIVAGQTLFYAATAAISALLVAVTREAATALSASAVYAGSALAYSGATLPLDGGNAFARIWSNALPLTHYIALQMGQISGQDGVAAVRPAVALLAYVAIAGGGAVALAARQARAR